MLGNINSKMSIGSRLALVSGLFVASSALVTSLLVGQSLDEIGFTKKERAGTDYLGNVWGAIRAAGQVDQTAAQEQFNAGDAAAAFQAAQTDTERLNAGLALITAVADGSNLTLDPDLDSFYAMDAATVKIPALLSAALELENAVSDAGDPARRTLLITVAADRVQAAANAAKGSMEAAAANNEGGETGRALSAPASALLEAASALIARAQAAAPGQSIEADNAAFAGVADASWRATADELSRLLDARVADKQSELMFQLALVALFMAVAGSLAWLVSSGLGRRFKGLIETMDRLRAGDLKTDVPHLDDSNETGKVAETLKFLRDSMVKRASDDAQIENERKAAEAERAERATEQNHVVISLASGLKQLSDGNLTSRLPTPFAADYEQLRSDFNEAMGKMQEAMKVIDGNARGIHGGAGELSEAADNLSRRTEQQAASLEETAASLDQITATVKKTSEVANHANAVVTTARNSAEKSGQVVGDTVKAMSEIEGSAKKISQIIGVIDEIAFQTNLLALNAGVEAARAGDAGRGFAVVASEVRALAQRSSDAAKEIKTLISASTQYVEVGVDLVGQSGKALQEIIGQVSEINALMAEISASAMEQSTGLAQVNIAVNQMDQMTQQNAAMVEETTAASHSLAKDAEELSALVMNFKIGDIGADAHEEKPRRHTESPVSAQRQRVAAFAAGGGKRAGAAGGGGGAATARKQEPKADWEEF